MLQGKAMLTCFSKIFFLLALILAGSNSFSQTSPWNPGSFKFEKSTSPLEDMTGATVVSFNGPPFTSSSIPISGFSFRYGLSAYDSFYVSPMGFIKLGSAILSNNPQLDSNVIVPLYNGTFWNASYKMTGAAPDRKMVVQFSGVMQPTDETTKFQLWLHERTGKIQFVYQHLRGFYGPSTSWRYKIFCKTNILGYPVLASLKVNPNNAVPVADYSSVQSNFDSIYANTRYSFQPDTSKPAAPASISASNIQPGCLTLNVAESSNNESVVMIAHADSATNFKPLHTIFAASPSGAGTYSYNQTSLQPFSDNTYEVFFSNGFVNSDTVYYTAQTLMPQINGIKKIPGDYPSISSLLQDAPCKHIGPNLIIELENNYSFASEPLPLTINSFLQTRLLESVVIRPAAGATITWEANYAGPLFYVDSVRNVFLDGRAGGTGTNRSFTIYQAHSSFPAIQYTNGADSGGINYCRVVKKSESGLLGYAIIVVPWNNLQNMSRKDVNALSITNNEFTAFDSPVSDLIYVKPGDTTMGRDFVISGNEFSRFTRSAIHFEGGGENLQISNNRFYQPVPVRPQVYLPFTHASVITLLNTETVNVTDNYFGGSSPQWGTGKYRMTSTASNFAFVNYQNRNPLKKAFITGNKFGNIESAYRHQLVYLNGGYVLLDGNFFGTADSTNSITSEYDINSVSAWEGTKIISNNFFSGIQGDYTSNPPGYLSSLISTSGIDSLVISDNDIGGSNNQNSITSKNQLIALYLGTSLRKAAIKGNNFRGLSSINRDVEVIGGANGIGGSPTEHLSIDSNEIHHIIAASSVAAININLNSLENNRISYNNIYALKTYGTVQGSYGPEGSLGGIYYRIYNQGTGAVNYTGGIEIFGNRIHSFESLRILPNSDFRHLAMAVACPITKIYNNEIRFGIDSRGDAVDSLTLLEGIVVSPLDHQAFLNDKHFFEHNSIYFGGKGLVGSALSAQYSYNYISPRNLLTVTNNIISIDREPLFGGGYSQENFQYFSSIKAVSANNLWYAGGDPSVQGLLQAYKQSCNCDSSSITGDPAFLNAAGDSSTFNLKPGSQSAADGSGTPSVLPIFDDILNTNRNAYSPVDIGCYAVTPCGTGIFPTIEITNSAADTLQLCSAAPLTLSTNVLPGQFTSLQWQKNLVDSIGATGATLSVNSSGSYRLVGTTACGSVASRSVFVSGNIVQPTVTIQTTVSSVCSGASVTFSSTLNNISPNPIYQWQVNGVNAGTNSNTFTLASIGQNSQVSLIVTSLECAVPVSTTSNTLSIDVLTSPLADAGRDTVICSGGAGAQLNGNGGDTYSWSPTAGLSNSNIPDPVANPGTTTQYILTATNANNCTSRDTVIVTVSAVTTPGVTISASSLNLCQGQAVTFDASSTNAGANPFYQWKVNGIDAGADSSSFTSSILEDGDIVSLELTSNAPCVSIQPVTSNILTVSVGSLVVPEILFANNILSVTNSSTNTSYIWENKIGGVWEPVNPPATGIVFSPLVSGEYRVIALSASCIKISDSIMVDLVVPPFSGIQVYPNPATNSITIGSINVTDGWEVLNLIDSDGRPVIAPMNILNQSSVTLNISSLQSGVYFVVLRKSNGSSLVIQIVKV